MPNLAEISLSTFFQDKTKKKTALDILSNAKNLRVYIKQFDFGHEVWSEDRLDSRGIANPGWVYQPDIRHVVVVDFTVNEGKGTGHQIIPVSEFKEYVAFLRSIIDNGFKSPSKERRNEYIPTWKIAQLSFDMIPGKDGKDNKLDYVSARSAMGQGAKPIIVHKDELPDVVSKLEELVSNLPEIEKQCWDEFEKQKLAKKF